MSRMVWVAVGVGRAVEVDDVLRQLALRDEAALDGATSLNMMLRMPEQILLSLFLRLNGRVSSGLRMISAASPARVPFGRKIDSDMLKARGMAKPAHMCSVTCRSVSAPQSPECSQNE